MQHLHANDTQIDLATVSRNLQECMNGLKLKPNPDKNEFIIMGDKHAKVTYTKIPY